MSLPPPPAHKSLPAPSPAIVAADGWGRRRFRDFFALQREATWWQRIFFGIACIALFFGVWWFVTRGGEGEQRMVSPATLPSPAETFATFHALWFDRALTRNLYVTLRRVTLGFGLAALVGIPLGMLAGCFGWLSAFLAPLSIFGRYIPIAALIPLTMIFWGIEEQQKVMFIFIACVAFIFTDAARSVLDVDRRYVDTAYTLGARRRQVILKVLVPMAMPSIFNSLRLLFGLAFGYIMLAELVKMGGEEGGLGDIIITSQRRGLKEHIYLVLMFIPLVALGIDRVLFWIQRELFPHRYGGSGILNRGMRVLLHAWEDLKNVFHRPAAVASTIAGPNPPADNRS